MSSVVNDLRDDCFVLATGSLHQIVEAFEAEIGRKPSLAELCEILTAGAQGCSEDLIEEAPNLSIVISGSVTPVKGVRRLQAGQLFCVPLGSGSCGVLICLGKFGSFGHAFGILKGRTRVRALGESWQPAGVFERPVFVHDEYVHSGRWRVVGQRPDLIKRFREPEIYHHRRNDPGDGSYGEFGLAESTSGVIRRLSAKEAAVVFPGGKVGSYRHAYLADQLEEYLEEIL
jgi:hypothetical protein